MKNDIDLFVFPDIQHSGLQDELRSQGYPTWGSGLGDRLEMNREKFHATLADLGLDVPPFEVVVGLTALREHLRDQQDKYIKVSKYRGNFETAHWRNWDEDEGMLDAWAVEFGPLKELVRFLVMDAIETDIEVGGDTYNVHGQFPKTMLQGFEWKDKGYFGSVLPVTKMPNQIRMVNQAFAPVLKGMSYCNFWSMELRIKGEKTYPTDPCCRCPCPGTASQTMIYENLGEIIWKGAHGELVEPVISAQFTADCVLTVKCEKGGWSTVKFPESLREWLWLRGGCLVDGRDVFPPNEAHADEIGWVRAQGNTIEETLDAMKAHVADLPDGVTAHTQSLFDLLKEIHKAEDEGMEFTDQKVPEPELALKD